MPFAGTPRRSIGGAISAPQAHPSALLFDAVLPLVLCILAAAVVESGRLVPRRPGRVVRGPMAGYARASGAVFRRADVDRFLTSSVPWRPITLETHHRRGRPRVALRIASDEPTRMQRDTLLELARALQRSTRAGATRVELVRGVGPDDDDGRPGIAWAIFAPDGRGWTGIEPATVALGRDEAGVWKRAAVGGARDLPAAGWLAPALDELGLGADDASDVPRPSDHASDPAHPSGDA